ncbi:hypothetical protein Poly51_31870 [Rubripirellula tenax]|uniref:Uncharacterized protein n=1 Tax=Rubripirellula tenax TaxID=2528015 RepID=A0A5C6EZ83_9BACT|nr:hypothetical protein Poly51_31870 [Rubripirellula tenax]
MVIRGRRIPVTRPAVLRNDQSLCGASKNQSESSVLGLPFDPFFESSMNFPGLAQNVHRKFLRCEVRFY